MKYLSPFILILLLSNMTLLAQNPTNVFSFEEVKNPHSYIDQAHLSSAKTLEEENLVIAFKREIKEGDNWRAIDSIEYKYNDYNQVVMEERKVPSSAHLYNSTRRIVYEYDAEGNEIFNEVQSLIEASWEAWVRKYKIYDSNNNLILEEQKNYYEDEWQIKVRDVYEYDSNNNLILYLNQSQKSTLSNNFQFIYEYDSLGNLTSELFQSWRENEWKDLRKKIFEYDGNNNRVQFIWQYKYPYFSNWQDQYRYVYEYDANNNLTLDIEYSWYGDHWGNNIRTEYEYDENENLILENYENLMYHQHFYDEQNNLTKTIRFDNKNNIWLPIYQMLYEYDIENNLLVDLLQRWEDDVWIDNQRKTYYYLIENESSKPKLTLELFPNPSTGQFIIDLKEHGIFNGLLEIFNSNGQLVHFQKIDFSINQLNVNLEGLSNGTYYLELSDDNTKIKQTLMLVH